MSEPSSAPDTDEAVLLQFQKEYEAAADKAAVVERYGVLRPDLAKRLQARAALAPLLGGMRAEPADPLPERLGEFRIVREVGGGGMGRIYEARHRRLRRRVALKTIRPDRDSPEAHERFRREQRALARLHQTHIVSIYQAGEEGPVKYFAMPYIDGAALHHVVRAARRCESSGPRGQTPAVGRLAKQLASAKAGAAGDDPPTAAAPAGEPLTLSAAYFRSVAKALADAAVALHHAHKARLLHRDVKPSNLMVDRDGRCWLIDFGLAGFLAGPPGGGADAGASDKALTTTGLLGTPQYMAPEQWAGARLDARTDVWGLGVTLYELLTLRQAFSGPAGEVREKILNDEPVAPRRLVGNVPADLAAVCRKAMRKRADDRYPTALAFADDLRRWLRGEPTAARPAGPARRVWMWARREPGWATAILIAVAAAVVLVVAGAAWGIAHDAQTLADQRRRDEEEKHKVLEAKTKAQVQVMDLLELSRRRLGLPTLHRRKEAQELLEAVAEPRRALTDLSVTDDLDLDLRSAFAATLAVPDFEIVPAEQALPAYFAYVWPTALQPDGKAMAVGFPDRPVRWERGQPLDIPKDVDPRARRPLLAYGPDGKRLAFAPGNGGLELWDGAVVRKTVEWKPREKVAVLAVGFADDGKTVWACGEDGKVYPLSLPDLTPGEPWRTDAKPGQTTAAAFRTDATRVAVGGADGRVRLYRTADGKPLGELPGDGMAVSALAWSSDGALAAGTEDGVIQVWDEAGVPLHRLYLTNIAVTNLVFDPSGRWLLAGSPNDQLRMWDVVTGEQVLTGSHCPGSFSCDGLHFSAGDVRSIAFYDLVEPAAVRLLTGHRAAVARLAWSGDGRRLASLDSRFDARVWDADKGIALDAVRLPRGGWDALNAALALSDDGRLLAYAAGGPKEAKVLIRDVQAHAALPKSEWDLPGGFDRLACVGGNKFLSVREEWENPEDPAKAAWRMHTAARDLEAGKPLGEPREVRAARDGDRATFLDHTLTPDGRFYLWVGPREPAAKRRAEVWDLAKGRLLVGVPLPSEENLEPGARLSTDGHWLLTGGGNADRLFNLTRDDPPTAADAATVALSRDAQWAVQIDKSPRLYVPALFLRHKGQSQPWLELVNPDKSEPGGDAVSFSADGRRLAWGSNNGVVTEIDLDALTKEVEAFEKRIGLK